MGRKWLKNCADLFTLWLAKGRLIGLVLVLVFTVSGCLRLTSSRPVVGGIGVAGDDGPAEKKNGPRGNGEGYGITRGLFATTDQPLEIVLNQTDSGGALPRGRITLTSAPRHGSVAPLILDVTVEADTAIYLPMAGYRGRDSFTYYLEPADGSPVIEVNVIVDVLQCMRIPRGANLASNVHIINTRYMPSDAFPAAEVEVVVAPAPGPITLVLGSFSPAARWKITLQPSAVLSRVVEIHPLGNQSPVIVGTTVLIEHLEYQVDGITEAIPLDWVGQEEVSFAKYVGFVRDYLGAVEMTYQTTEYWANIRVPMNARSVSTDVHYSLADQNCSAMCTPITVEPGPVHWVPTREGNVAINGVSATGASRFGSVFSTSVGRSCGKYYFEFTVDEKTTDVSDAYNLLFMGSYYENVLGTYGYESLASGMFWNESGAAPAFTVGQTIGVALNLDEGTVAYFRDGKPQAFSPVEESTFYRQFIDNPHNFPFFSSLNLLTYNPVFPAAALVTGTKITANFGVTPLKYAPPNGFFAGWPIAGEGTQDISTNLTGTDYQITRNLFASENHSSLVNLLQNDQGELFSMQSVQLTRAPEHGVIKEMAFGATYLNGNATYIPDGDYTGPDFWQYDIQEANGDRITVKVKVDVLVCKRAPNGLAISDAMHVVVVSPKTKYNSVTKQNDLVVDDSIPVRVAATGSPLTLYLGGNVKQWVIQPDPGAQIEKIFTMQFGSAPTVIGTNAPVVSIQSNYFSATGMYGSPLAAPIALARAQSGKLETSFQQCREVRSFRIPFSPTSLETSCGSPYISERPEHYSYAMQQCTGQCNPVLSEAGPSHLTQIIPPYVPYAISPILANGGLTASTPAGINFIQTESVLSVGSVGWSCGKRYFEVTINVPDSDVDEIDRLYPAAGIGDLAYLADGAGGSLDGFLIGATTGVAVDLDAGTISFNYAGTTSTRTYNISDRFHSMFPFIQLGTDMKMTINFGASSFQYSPPPGYVGW